MRNKSYKSSFSSAEGAAQYVIANKKQMADALQFLLSSLKIAKEEGSYEPADEGIIRMLNAAYNQMESIENTFFVMNGGFPSRMPEWFRWVDYVIEKSREMDS